jgi:hypothetical protein
VVKKKVQGATDRGDRILLRGDLGIAGSTLACGFSDLEQNPSLRRWRMVRQAGFNGFPTGREGISFFGRRLLHRLAGKRGNGGNLPERRLFH